MTTKQFALPAVYARGGTSRAVIFKKADLPQETEHWAPIFQAVLGSPDPESSQLDGLGGGITSLSKIAVLAPSSRPGVDVDYLFVQVDPQSGALLYDANCGNISSVVGPFAVDEGWVSAAADGAARVRIYNENSRKLIEATFNLDTPEHEYIEISGVSGRAAPILLRFEQPEGSMAASAFPTGNHAESLLLADGDSVNATLIDINVPCVIVSAAELGMTGDEATAALLANTPFLQKVVEIRVAAALKMNLCATEHEAREVVKNVPDVIVVAKPGDSRSTITARYISCDRPHRSAPVTSSMALAAATKIPGTIAAQLSADQAEDKVTIRHPAGWVEVLVDIDANGTVQATSIHRTARRIMQGEVLVPESQRGR